MLTPSQAGAREEFDMETERNESTAHLPPQTSSSAGVATERLEAIACIIAEEEALWGPHRRHDPQERHYARLVRTDEFEAWLLTWTSSRASSCTTTAARRVSCWSSKESSSSASPIWRRRRPSARHTAARHCARVRTRARP
jgi:hypothetical protein